MNSPEFVKLYQKAIKALALRARSVKEIRDKLSVSHPKAGLSRGGFQGPTLKGIPSNDGRAHDEVSGGSDPNVVEQVIQKLLSQNLLNDAQFAQDYIRYQLSVRPLGERALSFRLRHLGVDQDVIRDALKSTFHSPSVALDLARRALSNKFSAGLGSPKLKAKVARFLASRGFSYATIRVLIDDTLESE